VCELFPRFRRTPSGALRTRRFGDLLPLDQMIVIGVGADPEPNEVVSILDRQRSVVQPDSNRPERPDSLEVERSVLRIRFEEFETAVGRLAHQHGQASIAAPKPRAGDVLQMPVQRPARASFRASRANLSRRPPATSRSSCRSQFAASYLANHRRNRARSFFGRPRTAALICSTVMMKKSLRHHGWRSNPLPPIERTKGDSGNTRSSRRPTPSVALPICHVRLTATNPINPSESPVSARGG